MLHVEEPSQRRPYQRQRRCMHRPNQRQEAVNECVMGRARNVWLNRRGGRARHQRPRRKQRVKDVVYMRGRMRAYKKSAREYVTL